MGTIDGTQSINFLYRLSPGMAKRSYGIECAMLAGLPADILDNARTKSVAMEKLVDGRRTTNRLVIKPNGRAASSSSCSHLVSDRIPCWRYRQVLRLAKQATRSSEHGNTAELEGALQKLTVLMPVRTASS